MIKRWVPRILLAAAVTIGIAVAFTWWQDRGLKVVEDRLEAEDAAGALAAVDRFLDQHPDKPDAVRAWAKAYLALGQFDPALQALESLAQIEGLRPAQPQH